MVFPRPSLCSSSAQGPTGGRFQLTEHSGVSNPKVGGSHHLLYLSFQLSSFPLPQLYPNISAAYTPSWNACPPRSRHCSSRSLPASRLSRWTLSSTKRGARACSIACCRTYHADQTELLVLYFCVTTRVSDIFAFFGLVDRKESCVMTTAESDTHGVRGILSRRLRRGHRVGIRRFTSSVFFVQSSNVAPQYNLFALPYISPSLALIVNATHTTL